MKKAVQMDEVDNVATVTSEIGSGDSVEVLSPMGEIISRPVVIKNVPFGHKIALKSLKKGEDIIKYGEVIGAASDNISLGEWIHTYNLESSRVPTSQWGEYGP